MSRTMQKSLTQCANELAELCKGTYLDEEARRVIEAIEAGYCFYHPYPETDLDYPA